MVTSGSEGRQDKISLFVEPTDRYWGNGGSKAHWALVSPPYGISEPVWDFQSVLLIASGNGITALAPYLRKIIRGYALRKGRTKAVHLVWQIEDIEMSKLFDQPTPGALTSRTQKIQWPGC